MRTTYGVPRHYGDRVGCERMCRIVITAVLLVLPQVTGASAQGDALPTLAAAPTERETNLIELQTRRSKLRWAGTFGAAAVSSSESEPDEDPTIFPIYHAEPDTTPEPERWSSFLPLLGEAAREQGFDLPLPLGFSVNYVHLERDIDVDDVDIRIAGGPKQSVKQFLQIDADSSVDVAIGRLDAWVLPFLNVHAYGGWQWNKSGINLNVTVPTGPVLPDIEFTVKDDGELDGPIYGVGATLAGGYEQWFMTANVDFAYAELDEFDSRFEGRVFGLRTGWNGAVFELPLRIWTGLSYYDTATTIDGKITAPNVGTVRFEVEQGPKNPWNTLIGANVGMSERIDVSVEYGFNFQDVQMLALVGTIRF